MITEKLVKDRLDHWGREFAYSRALVSLGHRSKDMLQILIEHRGEMPPKVTGYKPEEVDLQAMEIEDCVTQIYREQSKRVAWVLRAYYCGSGRRGVERFQLAKALCLTDGEELVIGTRGYYLAMECGVHRVWGMLSEKSRARGRNSRGALCTA